MRKLSRGLWTCTCSHEDACYKVTTLTRRHTLILSTTVSRPGLFQESLGSMRCGQICLLTAVDRETVLLPKILLWLGWYVCAQHMRIYPLTHKHKHKHKRSQTRTRANTRTHTHTTHTVARTRTRIHTHTSGGACTIMNVPVWQNISHPFTHLKWHIHAWHDSFIRDVPLQILLASFIRVACFVGRRRALVWPFRRAPTAW